MEEYNPNQAPTPEEWQAWDEEERIFLIEEYHRKTKVKIPKKELHATIHTIVENQIAMGTEIPVMKTLDRLISEGLDRHEAIHAIGSVLIGHLMDIIKLKTKRDNPNLKYYKELEKLTAAKWKNNF